MNYTIRQQEGFSVIGQEVALTGFQTQNLQISTRFWTSFNASLKKAYLSPQTGNWLKYAFMQKHGDTLYYYCAVPKRNVVPEGFVQKDIPPCHYLVAEHTGAMNRIYDTYRVIYKELLPESGYSPAPAGFLHFERYDRRFYWNRPDSVIEIWVPVKISQTDAPETETL